MVTLCGYMWRDAFLDVPIFLHEINVFFACQSFDENFLFAIFFILIKNGILVWWPDGCRAASWCCCQALCRSKRISGKKYLFFFHKIFNNILKRILTNIFGNKFDKNIFINIFINVIKIFVKKCWLTFFKRNFQNEIFTWKFDKKFWEKYFERNFDKHIFKEILRKIFGMKFWQQYLERNFDKKFCKGILTKNS